PGFDNGTTGWSIWDKHNESSAYHPGIFTVQTASQNIVNISELSRGAVMQTVPYQAGKYFAIIKYNVPDELPNHTIAEIYIKVLNNQNVVLPASQFVPPTTTLWLEPGEGL